ncbi:DUF6417 family protein [Streptomyces sp. NPDC059994]|uniref:DUF6417 family protein n=1 Tax=Streptomyces sp. NPDC059994 TaxID=3347029 RepID=UPI00367797E5
MTLRGEQWDVLRALEEAASGDGWVTPGERVPVPVVRSLAGLGLCELAPAELLPTLGRGRQLAWAARLTVDGHDALVYQAARAAEATRQVAAPQDPLLRAVAMRASDMDILRRYLALAPTLCRLPSKGLDEVVRAASWDAAKSRFTVWVTDEQVQGIAHAFFLERMAASSAPANRLGREYGITCRPAPSTSPASPGRGSS